MKRNAKHLGKRLLSLVLTLFMLSSLIVPEVIEVTTVADTYTRNEEWDYSSSTPHITCAGDLLQFVWLVNEGTSNFSGKTVYLDCDIDLNPNWSAAVSFSAGTGTGLSASTGIITLPSAPSTAWTNTMKSKTAGSADQPYEFNGTFDGQGHTISGIYYKRTSSVGVVCKNCGLLFNRMGNGAVLKNLAVLNSIFIWSENAGNSEIGIGGLVGGATGTSIIQSVYAEVNVVLQSKSHPKATLGGLAGWRGGTGKIEDCAYKGIMVTTDGTDAASYPSSNANHVIGGIVGEQEGTSKIIDALGIVTFAVKEPSVSVGSVNQNSGSGGANQAIAGHYDSAYGTKTRVCEGAQNSDPSGASGYWRICSWLKSYAPKNAVNNVADTSWFGAAGTYTLTTARQLLGYFELLATGTGFGGSTIKLGNSIDVNPGWDLNLNFNSSDQATIPTRPPKVVWTCDKKCTGTGFSGGRWNYGVFDGQGYVIRGLYSSMDENETGSGFFGAFEGKDTQPAIQNLIIQNSYIQNTYDRQCNMSGLVTAFRGRATIQNVFIDIDLCARNSASYVSQIGAISNGGGSSQNTYTTVISNVVYAGTIANLNGRDIAIAGGKTNDRITVTWQDPNSVKATVTDVLNMGSIFTNLSEVSDGTGTGFQNIGPNKSNITATRVQGKFYKKSQYPYKQTTNPGSWVWMPAYESYFPAGVANLQGFVKNGDINDLVTKVDAVKVNSANAYPLIAEGSVYTIDSVDEMKTFGNLVASCSESHSLNGICFKLTTDIDLNPGWDARSYWTGTDASTWRIKFPEAASYYWPANKACFAGILDGDGHTLAGLYSTRLLTGQYQSNGGLFGSLQNTSNGGLTGKITSMRSARVSNLAITNSAVISIANAGSDRGNAYLGGITASMQWGATVNNCYIDMSVLIQTFNGIPFIGGVAGFTANKSHKPNNQIYDVVIAEGTHIAGVGGNRSSIPKASDGWIGHTAQGPNARMGGLIGRTEGSTIIARVLMRGALHENFGFGPGNYVQDQNVTVNFQGGGDGTDCFYNTTKTSSVAAWSGTGKDGVALQTNQVSTLGTYTPCSVVPSLYAVSGNNLAISNYNDNAHFYKPGTSFAIGSFTDYTVFVAAINAGSYKGNKYVFNITADMNINPSWRAKGDIDWDSSAHTGSAEYTAAPGNLWPVMENFCGTLDGQGHLIEGIYANRKPGANGPAGMFANNLWSGATFKNLVIRNSRYLVQPGGGGAKIGIIAGTTTGSNITIENVYLDVDIIVATWSASSTGAFIGQVMGNNYDIKNSAFVGRIMLTKPSSTTSYAIPTTTEASYVSQLVADPNWKTTLNYTNMVLGGVEYLSTAIWANTGNLNYHGSNNTPLGEKAKYYNVMIQSIDLEDGDMTDAFEDEEWVAENFYGSSIDASAFSYSTKAGMQLPATLQAIVDGGSSFHNFEPVTLPITSYTGSEISGSIFTIANASDLMYAVDLSQDQGVTFNGYTLRLTANIDLNPGWNGHVAVADNKATLPNLPINLFRGFDTFRGTFDGSGYYIAGICMIHTIVTASDNVAPFLTTNGAVIKNLKLIRGFIMARDNYDIASSSRPITIRIAGLVARNSGTLTIQNVYNAMEVWYNGNKNERVAGFVGINHSGSSTSTLTMDNVKFAGVIGVMADAGSTLPVATGSASNVMSQLVADGGSASGDTVKLNITSFTMAGTAYAPAGVTATNAVASGLGNGVVASDENEGPGTATVTSGSAYTNRLGTFSSTVYASWAGGTTTYEGSHDTYVYSYQSIDFYDNFNAFSAKLTAAGYTGYTNVANYRIGNNYYAQFENPNQFSLFVSFISTGDQDDSQWRKGRGSVFVSPAGTAYNNNGSWAHPSGNLDNLTEPTPIPASNLCSPQIWQLDVDNSYSTASGGMGYVIRLANGHFIVIDGGYRSVYDARHVYKILCENNAIGGTPVIEAWFITHLHDDHFGLVTRFASLYAANVNVEAFYFNFPSDTVAADPEGDDEGINTDNVYKVMFAAKSWPSAKIYKPHAGQTFLFHGLNVTIMATHESVAMKYYNGKSMVANSFYNGNDTSMVAKFTFFPGESRQQSFMMTGDACEGISRFLTTAYTNSDLEVDIIQVSHHGWKGLTAEVYEMMDKSSSTSNRKTIYLWPQDVSGYSKTGSGVNTVWYYAPTAWNNHENQQGKQVGGCFGYMYSISQSNSTFGAANYFIRTRAQEVIPAYTDHCLTLPYKKNTYYSQSYWTSSSYSKVQEIYTAKRSNAGTHKDKLGNYYDVWDGSAGNASPEDEFPIKDWWNDGADSTYNIESIVDFNEFIRIAKSNSFSGKTVNLNCNITLNDYDGAVTFDGTQMVVQSGLNVWTPIPTFSGTFNGNGHTIKGLYAYVTYNNTGVKGGFIKTLAGGTIKDFAITNSAIVFENKTNWGSASMIEGAIVGEVTGSSTIQDCIFDVNSYVITAGATSFAGVLAKIGSEATANITRVTYSGAIGYVTAGYTLQGGAQLSSGQNVYGPMGILGHNNGGTANLNTIKFVGQRLPSLSVIGGSSFSTDLYASSVTTGTVNLTGTNIGSTTGGAAPAWAVYDETTGAAAHNTAVTESTHAAPNVATTTDPAYVYVPQLGKVVDAESSKLVNPVNAQRGNGEGNTNKVRFVGTMTRKAAQDAFKLGFKLTITYGGQTRVVCTEQWDVYQSISAAGQDYAAEDLGGEYLYALVLNGVPQSGTITIKVQTRYVDQNYVEHFGAVQTVTITNGVVSSN